MNSLAARAAAFAEAAQSRHGSRYDYRLAVLEYVNAHTKVTIVCPDHGSFRQPPNDHKRGARCPDCSARRASSSAARAAQFLERAATVHGDRYSYDGVVFVDQHTPVSIICRDHGPFHVRPDSHLAGRHCHHCAAGTRTATLRVVAPKRKRPRRTRGSR